jgi:hypothetical protein
MKFKEILKNVAPSLGAAIGGPYGVIAGKLLAGALGEKEPSNEKALDTLVQKAISDPALVMKLKEAEQAFDLKMEELGVDVYKTEVDDRKNARDMAKLNMWPQIALTIVFIIGYFWLLYVFLTTDTSGISEWQKGIVGTLLGILTAAIPQILAFWLGSSHGSQKKDARIPAQ